MYRAETGAIQRYEFEVPPSFAAALLLVTAADSSTEASVKIENNVSKPKAKAEPEFFDDVVGTDARGVKVYEID